MLVDNKLAIENGSGRKKYMSSLLRILICVGGAILLYNIRKANINRKITEKQSLYWIILGVVIISFGLFPKITNSIANLFSVDYPPSIIFAIFIMLMFYGVLNCYKTCADLNKKVQELAIQVSLLNEENYRLKKEIYSEDKNIFRD